MYLGQKCNGRVEGRENHSFQDISNKTLSIIEIRHCIEAFGSIDNEAFMDLDGRIEEVECIPRVNRGAFLLLQKKKEERGWGE